MIDCLDPITNREDMIDSRDIIARIDYLQQMAELADDPEDGEADAINGNERAELALLKALAKDGKRSSADWINGATLVRESYFQDFALQYAEGLGLVRSDTSWPYVHIDWAAAASDLRGDYVEVEFDGVTYLVR